MARYDRVRGYGRGYPGGGYGGDYRSDSSGGRGFEEQGRGPWPGAGSPFSGGYDRGLYGSGYPGYRGVPGGPWRGQYHGGGYGRDYSGRSQQQPHFGGGRFQGGRAPFDRGGYERSYRDEMGGQWGEQYDSAYAREPFLPEEAYARHPEYNRPQRHIRDRWPGERSDPFAAYGRMDDDEVLQAVRMNIFQDNWVDAGRIEVEVEDGIVTLKGDVDDFLEARYAWDDAWETPGVRGVVNHIHVHVEGPAGEHDTVVQGATGTSKSRSKAKKSAASS